MPPRGSIQPPEGIPLVDWEDLCKEDPGSALAYWMESMEGRFIESEGPNRGPWLRSFLLGGDGLPYCADAILSFLDRIGGPKPLPFVSGKHSYWHNRSVDNLEKAHQRGGTWLGPSVPPWRGLLVFWADRRGSDRISQLQSRPRRHVDVVSGYHPGEREITVIGANVGDTFKSRRFRLGHPRITGFGAIVEPLRD